MMHPRDKKDVDLIAEPPNARLANARVEPRGDPDVPLRFITALNGSMGVSCQIGRPPICQPTGGWHYRAD
jgi:hypothetical protein